MMPNKKIRIGFHSDATGFGGAEAYLGLLIKNIDLDQYDVFFFHKAAYPLKQVFGDFDQFTSIAYDQKESPKTEKESAGESRPQASSQRPFNLKEVARTLWRAIVPQSVKMKVGFQRDIEKLSSLFQEYQIDIFHSNETSPTPDIASIAASRAGINSIIGTIHLFPSEKDGQYASIKRDLIHQVFQAVNKMIYVSHATRKEWLKKIDPQFEEKIQVIHNGVQPVHFDSELDEKTKKEYRQELNISTDDFVILLSGRLNFMKGHKYLMEALPTTLKEVPNLRVLFAGGGGESDDLQAQAKVLQVEHIVRFLGHRSDMKELMKLSDIVTLPSVAFESCPFALIEAMACSKPIVASDFSGIPEIVNDGETGILVVPKDPDSLSGAIIKLLKDSEMRKRMGEAGRKRVEEMFTLDQMLQKTYGLYEELLKDHQQ